MVIEVDLECSRCYKKIKKVLCKIPRESLFLKFNLSVYMNVQVCVFMWLKKKKKTKTELYILSVIFVNIRNTRPGIQREGKLGGNQSGMLLC